MSVPRTYSVWSYDRQIYDYYLGDGPNGTHAGAPPRRASSSLGQIAERSTWSVPMGAKKIGSGELPRGRIASFDAGGGSLGDLTSSGPGLAFAAVVAYFAWKALR